MAQRRVVQGGNGAAGAQVHGSLLTEARMPAEGAVATSVVTPYEPRDYGPGAAPVTYPDPDVLSITPAFDHLRQNNSPLRRLWTGGLWAEGPAWNSVGRFLLWSDIPNNRQLRWLEEDGHVSTFRSPTNNSNGNTFDFQGRQVSCEHLGRRLVRHELDGSMTVLASHFEGKRLNSPNDVVAHPDGSYWFTDPPYGAQLYEGTVDAAGGPANRAGKIDPRVGQPAEFGSYQRELPTSVYRVDKSGRIDLVVREDQVPDPNGLCFSPDYKKLYIVSTGRGPGDEHAGGKGDLHVFDVRAGHKVSGGRLVTDFVVDGIKCKPDGLRADVEGNLWCASAAGRNPGYSGVTIWSPAGELIGRIRLPEACANVCFGGPKRNRLFMAASQSVYALYTATQGATPG